VHFADSNRRPPGCCHLGFSDVLEVLKGIGYNKYISMEMMPWPTPAEAARQSVEYIKGILTKGTTK
jgi:sugar phosphate isomerase/epimerase